MADSWQKDYQDWLKDVIENFDISDFFKQKSKEEFLESEYVSDLPLDKDSTYGDYLRELKKTKKYETEDYPGKGEDYFGDIKEVREKRKQEAMEGLAKGMEQRGFIGEDYDRYDRPRKDIEMDLLISKPQIKPGPEKDLSMWQKIGKHFGENADKRDQLFTMLGSMGKELVKPIEPGKEAAGALVPTLSRGLGKGEEAYAGKQAAAVKRALDLASAQQKINPQQYYSNKMQEARTMVPEGIEPGSLAETQWIGNYLRNQGIPSQVLDLQTALTEAQLSLGTASEEERPNIQKNINAYISQIQILLNQSLGSGGSTDINTIAYLGG
jgi:hypothetical protein